MPDMSRRVFLHIGAPKTGTTYLQDRLTLNRSRLAEQDIHYPETRTGDHFEPALDVIQKHWGGQLKASLGQWDALVESTRKLTGTIVVSHEILAAATAEQVERVHRSFAGDELHIVYTARDLVRQIPAEWQETVKHRGRMRFARFVSDLTKAPRTGSALWFWRVQGLPDVLARWSAGLPPECVHVVTVPQAGAPKDLLWQRFATVLGIEGAAGFDDNGRVNQSMGIAEAAVIRRLNAKLKGRSIPRRVYAGVVRELIVHGTFSRREGAVRAQISPKSYAFVSEVTGEWREWIQGSGVDVVGDLAELDPVFPDPDDTWVNPDQPTDADMTDAAIDALAEVITEITRNQPAEPSYRRIVRKLRRP